MTSLAFVKRPNAIDEDHAAELDLIFDTEINGEQYALVKLWISGIAYKDVAPKVFTRLSKCKTATEGLGVKFFMDVTRFETKTKNKIGCFKAIPTATVDKDMEKAVLATDMVKNIFGA